jgi:hypothetical protein
MHYEFNLVSTISPSLIGGPGLAGVSLISDDNVSATQFTRVLNLVVRLPWQLARS